MYHTHKITDEQASTTVWTSTNIIIYSHVAQLYIYIYFFNAIYHEKEYYFYEFSIIFIIISIHIYINEVSVEIVESCKKNNGKC